MNVKNQFDYIAMRSSTILKNKIILVTGASRGFGYQAALQLAYKGAHLIICARTVGALENLSDKILDAGGLVTVAPLDLCKDTELQIMSRIIFEKFGKIDIFIHSVYLATPMSPLQAVQKNELQKFFETNTFLTQRVIQMMHPLLKLDKKSIALFILDTTKYKSRKFLGVYNATRAASQEMVSAYAAECKRLGPRVLTFEPKPMPTKTRQVLFPGENKKKLSTCEKEAERMVKFITSNL